jgi:hypothetical protein
MLVAGTRLLTIDSVRGIGCQTTPMMASVNAGMLIAE